VTSDTVTIDATTASDVVLALIDACNRRDVEAALKLFHTDAFYHNIPVAPARGLAEIRAVLGPFLAMASEVDWVVHHLVASADGIVMTERTDRFLLPSGWLELPVMGVFEIRDGLIKAWRDYFDMALLRPIMGG
jgi:limonene-1,2-epoxide hydrolase